MKLLLIITAILESVTGLVLLIAPSFVVMLLLGAPLDTPAGLILGRLTGGALLALGRTCWVARIDPFSRAATGIISGLLVYNLAAVGLFIYARLGAGLSGLALWPAVVVHTALAVWCVARL